MKIGTYNIWNDRRHYDARMDLLPGVIREENFDFLALQEVRDEGVVERIKGECGFKHHFWKQYHDCQEGLAVYSNYELKNKWTNWDENTDIHNSGIMSVNIEVNDKVLSFMNVHLDCGLSTNRETEIIKGMNYLNSQTAEYKILLGDFNTSPNSKVYRFLNGQESLNGSNAEWIDLAESYCIRNQLPLEATLDFLNNPRWFEEHVLYTPSRVDWILLQDPYPGPNPKFNHYKLMGKELHDGITPSDHYGVVVDLDF